MRMWGWATMKIDILGEDKSALEKPILRFQLKKFE
jgi:hypothetical protein